MQFVSSDVTAVHQLPPKHRLKSAMLRKINSLWSMNTSGAGSTTASTDAPPLTLTPVIDEDEDEDETPLVNQHGSALKKHSSSVESLTDVVNSGRVFDLPRICTGQVKIYISANKSGEWWIYMNRN